MFQIVALFLAVLLWRETVIIFQGSPSTSTVNVRKVHRSYVLMHFNCGIRVLKAICSVFQFLFLLCM